MTDFRIDPADAARRARAITHLWLDCDGVLTDGTAYFGADGGETKRFNIHDGHGIVLWRRAGHGVAIISGRGSPALERRAEELAVDHLVQRTWNKLESFERLVAETGADPAEIAFVGDDVVDIPVMRRAGLAIAPANAVAETIAAAHVVTARAGGMGAVREAIEFLLKSQGRWDELMARYLA